MKSISRHIAILSALLLLCAACQPDTGCRAELEVTTGVTVEWVLVDTTGQGTVMRSWDAVSVQGVGVDSILYENNRSLQRLRLPLRMDTNVTQYAIRWHDMEDILTIRHTNDRHYISMACGCVIYHTIDSVWTHGVFIDSLSILNSTVENYEQDNIYLHLAPQYVTIE